MRPALALLVTLLLPFAARAQQSPDPSIPAFVKNLPEGVQDAVEQMAEARDPPDRFMRGMFGLPRARFGSGTSWLPDSSPLYAVIPHVGRWGFMVHGNVYAGYSSYNSKRGWRRFMGRNTLMGAVFRTFKSSELLGRLALSLEPLTIGRRGYPQILQTGQESDGTLIHDRMYALDFFRELAVTYHWKVTKRWAALVYAAAAGEPALGPVTFTQRVSASPDPLAPLGFQAQENSHASFGVLTVGAYTRALKLEASWFNGEVPGLKRYGIYFRKPDSYSVRVSYNPGISWSMQLSYGFLEQPVPSEPDRSDHRLSASVSYTNWLGADAGLACTVSLAQRVTTRNYASTALLAEVYRNFDGHHTVFGRGELLQKDGIELELENATRRRYAVGTLAAGYVYYFTPLVSLVPGLGGRFSINPMDAELVGDYGRRVPIGVMVFAQLRTAALPGGS
jgi:hypothetical protein